MHTRNFYGVDIEEDLGIPLSYDAAWKIFNRWPREVRVQHQRLGQRATPSKHAWCFCEEKNCTTRCPFFGFYRQKDGQTENKLSGIMTHAEGAGERGTTEYKGLLRSLNKWYNSRCAAGSSQVLDLSKLEQLKIKYKYPVFALNKKHSSRRFRRRDSRTFFYNDSKFKQPSVTSSKTYKHSRAIKECDSSELYYTIEKQLRNLSVSQSRLKHMSASLCRLAYAKKQASRTKLGPKINKRKVVRRYRSDIPIVSNSESTGNTNTSKTSNFCSKSSRNSKSTKSTEISKGSKTTESSKSSKARKISKSSKHKKPSKPSKPSESSKTTEITKAIKRGKVSKDSKVSESSKVSASRKTSKTSKTSKTTESSKTSDSYKSINDSKVTNTSKNSDSSRGKDTSKSGYTSKTGATSKSGGAASLSTDVSKCSRTSKSKATNKSSASSKATNVTTATTISHPVVRSIRFNLAKGKRGATRSAGDDEVKCKRKATGSSVVGSVMKVEKPQIQRIGGANEILNRSNRRPIVAWNSGASGGAANRKPTVEAVTKSHSKFASNHLSANSCLIRKHYKRAIFIDAGSGGDAGSHHGGRRKLTRKPSVRISKPILSFFRKQRTISKQSMTMRGKKSRCFFIKGERRK